MTAVEPIAAAALDLGLLAGDWRNTNARGGIARIVCEPASGGRMTVRCYGRCEPRERDWGTAEARVFAFEFASREAGAFFAVYDFGFEEVRIQANVKAGVLVVVTLNSFRDGRGRANYFNREFYYRAER
jgi:hypothetical protein